MGEVHSQIIDTVCPGELNVMYSVDQHAGSSYIWSVSGGLIKSGNGTSTIKVDWFNQTGLYRISVIEKNVVNCAGTPVSAYVLIKGIDFQINYPQVACVNDTITCSGIGGDKYLWSNGDTNSTIRIRLTQDTILSLKISNAVCAFLTDTFTMQIKASKGPIVAFTPDDAEFYKDQNIYFKYLGNNQDKVTWLVDKSSVNRIVANNINVTFMDTGQVYIKLIAVNNLGCKDSLTKMINIKDENIFIPNAFTPNGDGLNDVFIPVSHGIKSVHMVIFNRWGEEIYVSDSMKEGWNGIFKGEVLSPDAYGYSISAVGYSGRYYYFNGTITLFR